MSIFAEVKEQLRLWDVAEHYGLHINRAGFTNCPFHQERTASMKLYDDHFYCFGCHSSGDVITLVEKLFGLQPHDAARKLQKDFELADIPYDYRKETRAYRESRKSLRKELEFKKWKTATFLTFADYCCLLRKWKDEFAPKNVEEPFHPLFLESLQELPKMEYYCDLFLYGTDEDIKEFKEYEERLVKRIADRISNFRQSDLGRTNPNLGKER